LGRLFHTLAVTHMHKSIDKSVCILMLMAGLAACSLNPSITPANNLDGVTQARLATPNWTATLAAKRTAAAALAATQNANYTASAAARATKRALTPTPPPSSLELIGHLGQDVAEFAAPEGEYNAPGLARSVAVQNQSAYVLQGADGPVGTSWGRLSIVDVSNVASPVLVGSFSPMWIATDVSVSGGLAYLTDSTCELGMAACGGNLYALDISTPIVPHKIGIYQLFSISDGALDPSGWFAAELEVQGDYAYVAGGTFYPQLRGNDCGLRVINISNPKSPKPAGALQCKSGDRTWPGLGLAITSNRVYVAGGETGLHIIDTTDPQALSEVGQVSNIGNVARVAVKDDLAFLAVDDSKLEIVNISNPTAPSTISVLKLRGQILGIAVSDNFVFVAAGYGGLRVIDISNLSAPNEVAFYDSKGFAEGVTVSDDYVYVADEVRGLLIFKFEP
jgi:hypothetical protein